MLQQTQDQGDESKVWLLADVSRTSSAAERESQRRVGGGAVVSLQAGPTCHGSLPQASLSPSGLGAPAAQLNLSLPK